MGVGDVLGGFYLGLEDKYYSVLDFFDSKGIPVGKFNDFLENKGIPGFPVTIAIILVLIAALYSLLFFGSGLDATVDLSLKDLQGNSLEDVQLNLLDSEDNFLKDIGEFDDGSRVILEGRSIGETLKIEATKTGYGKSISDSFQVLSKGPFEISLYLERFAAGTVEAKIKLVDATSSSLITGEGINAVATFGLEGFEETRLGQLDANGILTFSSIPIGQEIDITIESDNYESIQRTYTFTSDELKTVSMHPKLAAFAGQARLTFIVKDFETEQEINDFKIKIVQKDGVILNDSTEDSGFTFNVPENAGIKFVISKDGYLSYDSQTTLGDYISVRQDDLQEIFLFKGGTKVTVNVEDAANIPISNALVQLFNAGNGLIDSRETGFEGFIRFEGLKTDDVYYVTASSRGNLPAGKSFSPSQESSLTLQLEPQTAQNSSNLVVTVTDNKGELAANAILKFYDATDSNNLRPLGIGSKETDLSGVFTDLFEVGKTIRVEAVKGGLSGFGETVISETTLNEIPIELQVSDRAKILKVVDLAGNPLQGNVLIQSPSKQDILFDGVTDEDGEVIFNAEDNKSVLVTYTGLDGNRLSEELTVEGLNEVKLRVTQGQVSGLEPSMNFLGIYDPAGNKVDGVSQGNEYYLHFEVVFPNGDYEAGMHVRVGQDDVKFIESEPAGITGFLGDVSNFRYGRTYNAFPAPGSESIDFSNKGNAGEFNKWVELYFDNPSGKKILKVRIKARETVEQDFLELHYRAWAKIGESYYREPLDSVLGVNAYTNNKAGLYAETKLESIPLLQGESFECQEAACVSYKFVTPERGLFETDEFKGLEGEIAGLELEVTAGEKINPVISFNTAVDPLLITLTGYDIRIFDEFIGSEEIKTDLQLPQLSLNENETVKVRAYFKPLEKGSTFITSQVVAGTDVIKETHYFSVFESRDLDVRLIPSLLLVGQDFTVSVKSSEGIPVKDATVKVLTDNGRALRTVIGDGSLNRGLNGQYFFKNYFDAGTYSLQVTADGFSPDKSTFEIGKKDLIRFEETEIVLELTKSNPKLQDTIVIENPSNETIDNIGIEFVKEGDFNPDFVVEAGTVSRLGPKEKATVNLTAEYAGLNKDLRLFTNVTLRVTGNVAGKYHTATEAEVKVNYNQLLPETCVEFDKKELYVSLLAESVNQVQGTYYNQGHLNSSPYNTSTNPFAGGSLTVSNASSAYANSSNPHYQKSIYDRYGLTKTVSVTAKNNCNQEITLIPNFDNSSYVEVSANELTLKPGEEKPIEINVQNKVNYLGFSRNYSVKLDFIADQLTKTIPLNVTVWSARNAIVAPDLLDIYLVQLREGERAVIVEPIHVMNVGEGVIEGIEINLDASQKEGINFKILPNENFAYLHRGSSIIPQKVLEVSADKAKSGDIETQMTVSGVIEGQRHNLKTIHAVVHVSAPGCLTTNKQTFNFSSLDVTKGARIEEDLTITNYCSEEVVLNVNPEVTGLGKNTLKMNVPAGSNGIIPVNQSMNVQLQLTKGGEAFDSTTKFLVQGLLLRSQNPVETDTLTANISLGQTATTEGLSSEGLAIDVCNSQGRSEELRFPISTKSNDCKNGYCDAVQASEYILTKLDSMITEAESNARIKLKGKAPRANANYIEFSELDVAPEQLVLFLKNDRVTPDLLYHIISKESKYHKLKTFHSVSLNSREDYESKRGSGFVNQMILDSQQLLEGCGVYYVRIYGSANVFRGEIETEKLFVFIDVEKDNTRTNQCTADIQNYGNFLPSDEGLTVGSSNGTWLGTIQLDNPPADQKEREDLEKLANIFAKGLYGKDGEKRFTDLTGFSKVLVSFGPMGQGNNDKLVKLSFSPRTSSNPDQPQEFTAVINEQIIQNESSREKLVEEAGLAIQKFINQKTENLCVTQDMKTFYFGSLSGKVEGALDVSDGPLEIQARRNAKTCSEFEIKSTLDKVELVVEIDDSTEKLLGNGFVDEITVEEVPDDGSQGREVANLKFKNSSFSGGKGVITIDKGTTFEEQEQVVRKYKTCVTGTNTVGGITLAHNQYQILVQPPEQFSPETIRVDLQSCSETPYDALVEFLPEGIQAQQNTNIERYAALNWSDKAGNEVKLKEVFERMLKNRGKGTVPENYSFVSSFNGKVTGLDESNPVYHDKIKDGIVKSTSLYAGACGAAVLVCPQTPIDKALTLGFSCLWPTVPVIMDQYESTKGIKDWLDDTFGNVPSAIWENAKDLLPFLERSEEPEPQAASSGNVSDAELADATYEEYQDLQWDTYTSGLGDTVASQTVYRGLGIFRGARLTKGNIRSVSQNLADQIGDNLVKKMYGRPDKGMSSVLASDLRPIIEADLKPGTKLTNDLINDLVTKAGDNPKISNSTFEEFIDFGRTNPTTKIGRAVTSAERKAVTNFSNQVTSGLDDVSRSIPSGDPNTVHSLVKQDAINKVLYKLEEEGVDLTKKVSTGVTLKEHITTNLKNKLKIGGVVDDGTYTATVNKQVLERETASILHSDDVKKLIVNDDVISKAVVTEVDTVISTSTKEAGEALTTKVAPTGRLARLKSWLRSTPTLKAEARVTAGKHVGSRWSKFWRGLARGFLCGAAGNTAGFIAWQAFYEGEAGDLANVIELNIGEEVKKETKEIMIQRGAVYKFVSSKYPKRENYFKVDVSVAENIPDNAKWLDDDSCDGSTNNLNAFGETIQT